MLNENILDTMVRMAADSIRNAYTEHGALPVGACVLASDGTLYTGCTIDNGCLLLALTAEMVAMAKAVSDGKRKFDAVVLVADTEEPYVPGGASCQFLSEFRVPEVILADMKGNVESLAMEQLLPYAERRRALVAPPKRGLFDDEDEE